MPCYVRVERSDFGNKVSNPWADSTHPLVTRNSSLSAVALLAAMLPRLAFCEGSPVSFLDQLRGKPPEAVSGNPAAESMVPGNAWLIGLIPGKPLDEIGLRLGGT